MTSRRTEPSCISNAASRNFRRTGWTMKRNSCGDCHLCCEYFTINMSDVPADAIAFWREWGAIADRQSGDDYLLKIFSPCRHLRKDGCEIYDRRPQFCRDFRCNRAGAV